MLDEETALSPEAAHADQELPPVFTEAEVAARYQVKPATVKNWRRARTGPAWFYAGRHVRYRESALLDWEKARELAASGGAA